MIMSGKLNSKIWSHTTRREDGVIFIGGKAVTDLAEKYETPSFILDKKISNYVHRSGARVSRLISARRQELRITRQNPSFPRTLLGGSQNLDWASMCVRVEN